MELSDTDKLLVGIVAKGLPIISRPYEEVGRQIGLSEEEVILRLADLCSEGTIKRFGVVVRHHELGYKANAMCVWDIPDDRIEEIAEKFSSYDFVTLCYRRPRRLPDWPYSLFCMIHGKEREAVLEQAAQLVKDCGLEDINRDVLFSGRRFKQRGARYGMAASQ
ncbi:MAG: AsnC family protein [Rhodospirillales bacterium]|nr:AsnC family protein [Rhodospirillales bacterium]